MGSVYELHLAIKAPPTDDARARAIVRKLSEQRHVEDLGGSWWRADYFDFEDREAAAHALHTDLRGDRRALGRGAARRLHETGPRTRPNRSTTSARIPERPTQQGGGGAVGKPSRQPARTPLVDRAWDSGVCGGAVCICSRTAPFPPFPSPSAAEVRPFQAAFGSRNAVPKRDTGDVRGLGKLPLTVHGLSMRFVWDGSDGTRTRGLRRDRPAL